MSGWTKGPWTVDGPPWNQIVWSSAENRVCFLAHSNGLDDARDIATARLIAAAPDLAEALEAVIRVADRSTVEFDMARAALLKAKGE